MPERESNEGFSVTLNDVIHASKHRWKLVAACATTSLFIGSISAFQQKPIWQSQFQIVLSNKQSSTGMAGLLSQSNAVTALAGGGADAYSDTNQTEVTILTSPSVLLPVFNWYVEQLPAEQAKGIKYKNWQSNVSVKTEKATTVLNVFYRDSNKSLLLPVARKIAAQYQEYSGRQRLKDLDSIINYLQGQINEFGPKARISSNISQNYASVHGLGVVDGLPVAGSLSVSGGSTSSGQSQTTATASDSAASSQQKAIGDVGGGSLESRRVATKQRITSLELQIVQAQKASNQLLYIASESGARTDKASAFDRLTEIDQRIAEMRTRFKPIDPSIRRLEKERSSLIGFINSQTIDLLKGELAVAKGVLSSLERPETVIRKHRELTQTALRNEGTLVELENNLAKFKLERARESDPWELISSPTVDEAPVSKGKKNVLLEHLFLGLVAGCGAATLLDKFKGTIRQFKAVAGILPYPILAQLHDCNDNSCVAIAQLLQLKYLAHSVQVALIPVGNDNAALGFAPILEQQLQSHDPAAQVLVTSDLVSAARCNAQILVITLGSATRAELIKLYGDLQLQGNPVAGILIADHAD